MSWKFWRKLDHLEESYVTFSKGKCAAKSSKRSWKPGNGQTCLCATASVLPFNGWFMVWMAASTGGFSERVCSPQHHARGSFWSDQADLRQPDEQGVAREGRRKAKMRLPMPWSGICGPNMDLLVLKWWSYQHIWLQPTLYSMELSPSWLFYEKWDALQGSFTESYVQLEGA